MGCDVSVRRSYQPIAVMLSGCIELTSVQRKKIMLKAKVAKGVFPTFLRRGARRAGWFKSK